MTKIMRTMGLAAGAMALLLGVGCSSNRSGHHTHTGGDDFRGVAGGRSASAGHVEVRSGGIDAHEEPRAVSGDRTPTHRTQPAAYRGSCAPNVPAGYNASGLAFPTGDAATSAIMLHQVMPATVRASSEFDYTYHVCNLTSGTLQNVVVRLDAVENMTLVSSSPSFQRGADGVVFSLGDLGPNETTVITVRAKAGNTGIGTGCISVSYNNVLCQTVQFVEPALQLAKAISPQPSVLRCDPITITYRVTNPGTGPAENVRVTDTLPNCMRLLSGGQNVDVEVGTLAAGESRDITVQVEAVSTGTCSSQAIATAAGNLRAESGRPEITIVEPVLAVNVNCPGRTFLGRNTTFEISGENTGNGAAGNAVMTFAIPAGAEFVSASHGGQLSGGNVVWNIGTLAAGAGFNAQVVVKANAAQALVGRASLSGHCAATANDQCQTNIEGIPAMLLDGFDDPDPIELGQTTTYTLTVTNQGSADLTNVQFKGIMATSHMEFVSATGNTPEGPVTGQPRGADVLFPAIGRLLPGQTATYRITVRAIRAGQVSFGSEAVSNEITVPLLKSETTNFFE